MQGHNTMTDEDRAMLREINRKLDTLIAALASDEDEEPQLSDLEGREFGGERHQNESLG